MSVAIVAMGSSLGVDQPGVGQTKASGFFGGVILNAPTDAGGVKVDVYDGASVGGTRIMSFAQGFGDTSGGFVLPFPVAYTNGLFVNVTALGGAAAGGEANILYQPLRKS
jgi:hypothetical protein